MDDRLLPKVLVVPCTVDRVSGNRHPAGPTASEVVWVPLMEMPPPASQCWGCGHELSGSSELLCAACGRTLRVVADGRGGYLVIDRQVSLGNVILFPGVGR